MTKTRIATHVLLPPPPPHATNAMGRRQYTTSLTSPVLALALAGCDKAVEPTASPADTSETDAPKGWVRRFIDKVTDFDTPSDYAITGGVAIGTVAIGYAIGASGSDSDTATPANQAPAFATATATAIAYENGVLVRYIPNHSDSFTYSLKPNTGDGALFSITDAGVLRFKTAPDYENPPLAKTSYSVTVIASDGNSGTADAEQTVTVTLTNINSATADTGDAVFDITGNADRALVAVVVQDDPDGNGTFTYKWQSTTDTLSGTETRADLTGWTDVSSTATYTPQSTDTFVRLQQVTYTDDGQNAETITLTYSASIGSNTPGNDYLFDDDNINITGQGGDDIIYGNLSTGQNLIGAPGNDLLYGNAGADLFIGGDVVGATDTVGRDIFVLELGTSARAKDVVFDFHGGTDRVRVDAVDARVGFDNLDDVGALVGLAAGETLSWVTNTSSNTRPQSSNGNDTSVADTVFFIDLDDDDALDSTETVVLILEDYSTTLTSSDFEIV